MFDPYNLYNDIIRKAFTKSKPINTTLFSVPQVSPGSSSNRTRCPRNPIFFLPSDRGSAAPGTRQTSRFQDDRKVLAEAEWVGLFHMISSRRSRKKQNWVGLELTRRTFRFCVTSRHPKPSAATILWLLEAYLAHSPRGGKVLSLLTLRDGWRVQQHCEPGGRNCCCLSGTYS